MLLQISTLVILGCFYPAVLSRPSVSLQNDGYGHYDFQYDVSHPKGSSRGHMKFGTADNKRGSHILDQTEKKNPGDYYAHHSPLSSSHNPDSYRAEKVARRPQDYANSPHESEILHEPRPIYPSPYDSEEKQLGTHNGALDEIYNSPVSKVNHQSPAYSVSVPEAEYNSPVSKVNHQSPEYSVTVPEIDSYPHPPQPYSPEPIVEQQEHPHNFVSSNLEISQEPISQVSEPAFNEPHESNHGDSSLNVQPVPVGPNYQFIPSGPPYVVDSHTTNIIHPPLPQDKILVQQPVDLTPHSQEAISQEPDVSLPPKIEVIQPALSHAFQLPVAPLPVQSPILPGPEVADVQQPHDSDLASLPGHVHPPPVSHAFRLPLLPIGSESLPIADGPTVDAVHSVPHSEHIEDITPIDPISHSTRLLIPSTISLGDSGAAPKALPDSVLGHNSINLGPQNQGLSNGLSETHSSVNSHVPPPISHAFRLSLPQIVPNHPTSSIPEVKPIQGPSPFTEVESPEAPQLPQLRHAFRLNLPLNQPSLLIPESKPVEGSSPISH